MTDADIEAIHARLDAEMARTRVPPRICDYCRDTLARVEARDVRNDAVRQMNEAWEEVSGLDQEASEKEEQAERQLEWFDERTGNDV